ncbi:MAG TPA: hypothetical protein VG797_07385 [Phycisphaerales bacterium]|nr:hypothetical protein [Phycisphaerales bacterium]
MVSPAMVSTLAAPAAPAPTIRAVFETGSEQEYEASLRTEITQARNGSAPEASLVEHAATVRLLVESAEADGSLKLLARITKLKLAWKAPRASAEFSADAENEPDKKPAADMETAEGELAALGRAIMVSSITMTIGPSGEVREISGLEQVLESLKNIHQIDERAVGFFTPLRFGQFLAPMIDAAGARDRPVVPGETWTREEEPTVLRPLGKITPTTTYTMRDSGPHRATIEGATSFDFQRDPGADPSVPTLTIGANTTTTSLTWDTARNRLVSRERTQDLSTTWTLGDITIEQTQHSVSRLALRAP